MRTEADVVEFSQQAAVTNPAAHFTRFFQGDNPDELRQQAQAVIAVLAADQGAEWSVSFADLAGGGEGHVFVLMVEFANNADAGVSAGSLLAPDARATGLLASQTTALQNAARGNLQAEIDSFGAGDQEEVAQTMLAGCSSGHRVGNVTWSEFSEGG